MNAQALVALELPAVVERLAALAETPHGEAAVRALEPSGDAAEVAGRQLLTSEAVALLQASAEPSLAGVDDVRDAVERAERGGALQPGELAAAARSIRVALDARRALRESEALASALCELLEPVPESLASVAAAVERAVEVDGSDLRDSASPLLRRLRSELRTGAARVREELARVARSDAVRDALQESFLSERGGRPVLAVRAAERARVPGIVHDASSSGQTLFVEPYAVVELSNRLSEAAAAAREEVDRILAELSALVAGNGRALRLLVEATAAVDVALACGSLSHRWRGTEVEVADEVQLLRARHPLLDAATAVPIDLDLGSLRALVISGPNTGGKTVALKTLGLAALLHQCGLRPPADAATLPVFDDVLADIGDPQSIAMSLSTFSGHVRSIVGILAAAGPRSLVLLDELAGGTDPDEGAALAQALVLRLQRQARLTVVTTHYASLKEWASGAEGAANAATSLDLETDEPLYSLALGRAGISHALRTAERLGVDAEVVADARARIDPARRRAAELLAEAEAAERVAADRRAQLERSLAAAAARESELEREVESVRASRDRARAEARAEAESELAAARDELRRLRDDLRAARRHERERVREATAAERERDRALGRAADRATRAEHELRALTDPLPQLAPLAIGDPVEARALGVRGTIVAIRGDEAEVAGVAGQRIRIPLAGLAPSAEPESRPVPPVRVNATAAGRDAPDELDVRGLDSAESRVRVRAFVDDAALAGLRAVRIVHGRGTGALRAAVRAELAAHPLVGGSEPDSNDGATVVNLS
ncbi:MAG TPA: Smr/MutS family protein [Gaiellaceae bacterium]